MHPKATPVILPTDEEYDVEMQTLWGKALQRLLPEDAVTFVATREKEAPAPEA